MENFTLLFYVMHDTSTHIYCKYVYMYVCSYKFLKRAIRKGKSSCKRSTNSYVRTIKIVPLYQQHDITQLLVAHKLSPSNLLKYIC